MTDIPLPPEADDWRCKPMAKTTWVILKEPCLPGFINLRTAHMVGFSSKKEAQQECDRLNERSTSTLYTLSKATVFIPWNP